MPTCKKCQTEFPSFIIVDNRRRELRKRKYCTTCVPLLSEEEIWKKVKAKTNPIPWTCTTCKNPTSYRRKFCDVCHPNVHIWEQTTILMLKERERGTHGRTIRNVARTTYYKSGKPTQCIVCGYNKNFHVCHITSVETFPETATIAEVNHIDNLVALCPNHHWEFDNNVMSKEDMALVQAQKCIPSNPKRLTPTSKGDTNILSILCKNCGAKITKYAKVGHCQSCTRANNGKKNSTRPNLTELIESITAMGYCATGRKYGVSDNNVRKWIKKYGIDPKTLTLRKT